MMPSAPQQPETSAAIAGRLRAIVMIVILDIAAPLAAYSLLRSAGLVKVVVRRLAPLLPR